MQPPVKMSRVVCDSVIADVAQEKKMHLKLWNKVQWEHLLLPVKKKKKPTKHFGSSEMAQDSASIDSDN